MGFQEFFRYLDAPLTAIWSWGAIAGFGDVFLAVWERDLARGRVLVFDPHPDRSHGLPERARHLQMIRSEHRRVFCVIRPGNWNDRRPEDYHEDTLLMVGGKLVENEKRGYIWLEDAGRIAAYDAAGARKRPPLTSRRVGR